MRVRIAREAGICYGVERALRLAENAAKAPGQVSTLGPLIHNPRVVTELEGKGVKVVSDPSEVARGDTLVIRTHGVAPQVIEAAHARGLSIVDATCPYVRKVHQAVRSLVNDDYRVLIVGDANHPEVIAVRACADDAALVVSDPADLPDDLTDARVGIVVQTTQTPKVLQAIVDALLERVAELKVFNTICDATSKRQEAARALAQESDCMIVVGGHNSGNTKRLAEICAATGTPTHHIESSDELDPSWFVGVENVGVTAGASTPEVQLGTIVEYIKELDA